MKKAIVPKVDPSKLEKIKAGIKTKTESGVKQNQNVTVNSRGDKIIAVEKEKKVEEAGVTRKKRNFVMYESKTGTEKETDLQRIKGKQMAAPKPRVEETVILKRKKKEYLDNYQYQETKELRKKKPAVVVHERLSDPVGGTYEEVSIQKTSVRSGSTGKNNKQSTKTTTTTTKTEMKTNNSTANIRSKPQKPERGQTDVTAKKTTTETTRIGRRSGPNAGEAKTTSKTTTSLYKDGETTSKTETKTRITRTKK